MDVQTLLERLAAARDEREVRDVVSAAVSVVAPETIRSFRDRISARIGDVRDGKVLLVGGTRNAKPVVILSPDQLENLVAAAAGLPRRPCEAVDAGPGLQDTAGG